MSRLPLANLLPDIEGIPAGLEITGLVMDSRAVEPGNAFIAIAGFGAHGLGFVDQARAKGAAAILFEPPAPADLPAPADAIAVPGLRARLGAMGDQFHGAPSRAMRMVGVTGTSGKTSTVQMLAQAFEKLGQRTGNTLFRAFILFTDNGLHGFDNEFGFHVQALRVFNLK